MWDKISFISYLNPVGLSCNVDGGECAFEDKRGKQSAAALSAEPKTVELEGEREREKER